MSDTHAQQQNDTQPLTGWRIKLGFVLLILSFIGIPLLVALLALFGVSGARFATISGGLLVAAEIMMIAGAAIAGKEGFAQIKARLFGYLKPLGPPQTVSRTRYKIGLVLFILPLVFGWSSFYLRNYIPGFEDNILTYGLLSDLILAVSLFLLGGDFWDKLRALFVPGATATFT